METFNSNLGTLSDNSCRSSFLAEILHSLLDEFVQELVLTPMIPPLFR